MWCINTLDSISSEEITRECVCVQAPECLLMRVMERLSEVDELQLFVDNCGKVAMDTGRGSSDVLLRHMKGEYLSESLLDCKICF